MDADKAGILVFLFALAGSLIPAFIASSKGRNFFLWYIYGFFLFPFALIHAMVIKPNAQAKGMKKCPNCASVISIEANICPSCRSKLDPGKVEKSDTIPLDLKYNSDFSGERNLASPQYQLFLTRRFGIEKNATLEKFVIGDNVFDTLEDSLREADYRYSDLLSRRTENEKFARQELKFAQEKIEIEGEKEEDNKIIDHATQFQKEAILYYDEAAKRRKIGIAVIVTIIGGAAGLFFIRSGRVKQTQTEEAGSKERDASLSGQAIAQGGTLAETDTAAAVLGMVCTTPATARVDA